MAARWKPVPMLKPGTYTAYQILDFVAKLILEEPLRYNQNTWRHNLRHFPKSIARRDAKGLQSKDVPDCGTIGCVAGWVVTVAPTAETRYWNVETAASHILGINYFQRNEFFAGGAVAGIPGTVRYARAGARHIRKFMRANEQQLKNHTVNVTVEA